MREAFAVQKLLTFFQQKYWQISDINILNFNDTLTNDVVSFEQPGSCVITRHIVMWLIILAGTYNAMHLRDTVLAIWYSFCVLIAVSVSYEWL